jgi:hypothetical protein
MELISTDINTMTYIGSEAEFNRAKMQGFWEVVRSLVRGCKTHLRSFDEVVKALNLNEIVDLGVRDILIKNITGSMGRERDFTRHFLPRSSNQNSKERWRKIYTLAATGAGFPPVELYQVGQQYFVKDGHHRISVAKYLQWDTIQAHVVEVLPSNFSLPIPQLNLCNGVELCTQQ